MNITYFIDELRNSDLYIHHIYSQGSCYKFHVLLSKMFKNCIPMISEHKNHIITKYRGKYYDIYGEVKNVDGYTILTKEELVIVKKWSFHKNNKLIITECPACEEPITF